MRRPLQPLTGLRVLDFSTLLPGPLATLILAEAGAEVIKVEPPEGGEELRKQLPRFGDSGVLFGLLNRGKKSVSIDLKAEGALDRIRPLVESADILVEQFRPGVMKRLGLDYRAAKAINPRIIYCSITGFGQMGERSGDAGHDLNYMALSGLLALSRGSDGAPVVPQAQVADIGAGSYPAVINILLALRERDRTGEGCALDISMTDNLFPFLWMAAGLGHATGRWPTGNDLVLNGASPRYAVYKTRDGEWLAVGALEDKFWATFCECIGLDEALRDDRPDPEATRAGVAKRVARKTAADLKVLFNGKDVCATIVTKLADAVHDRHIRGRGLFDRTLTQNGLSIPAAAVPLAPRFRPTEKDDTYPELGSANALIGDEG
ncbi:MAG: CoA transferase [Rhodospirillaceae bacterium]|nr:CoA transferase [Rhodospirillaceae bacterium]